MTKFRFLTAAAWGSLASALLVASLPAQAQDPDRGRAWGREARAEARAEAQANGGGAPERSEVPRPQRADGRSGNRGGSWAPRSDAVPATAQPGPAGVTYRGRDWAAQRQAREDRKSVV